ncbi:Cu-binding protein [Lobosporangium transversale]|uniref:SCO1/SenC-domain-containing protein n=1 Tax=Lobosporangium transversale TaxID=64571 RepID=A0A1Y2H407_9FUNG|nr:SCO1/SenC-domain-containing protein [Lobosporangium transversale]KAF9918698.1 Cu-binding protein [Lobosporangium transversale]ORZ28764.1 SCO1/SenC-domain-containing protein [Lobosporangium transversale]|eukprot:XP_021886437.1 SCO1/SenC-domain-containing protein [Lobosporangium transversale]
MQLPVNCNVRYYSNIKSEGARAQSTSAAGALNWKTLAVFTATGAGLLYYFREEKKRVEAARAKEARLARENTTYGKPKIGGPFSLIDQNGVLTTNEDFKGRYMLIYFGFTNCPDICPEELDKMAEVLDTVNSDPKIGNVITPIFITCDPQRDTVSEVKNYVKEFHKDLIGLTGSMEEIAKVAKAYRVYFSKPPKVAEGEDYLVDHSIFFYLMSPEGEFVDCYAKDHTAEHVSESVKNHIQDYINKGGKVSKELASRRSQSSS